MRATMQVLGISVTTVMKLPVDAGTACAVRLDIELLLRHGMERGVGYGRDRQRQ